ncbi:MAG: response regulator [Opitutaceae bacterium]|nr:response regulator [Opitutaceae bacterium]
MKPALNEPLSILVADDEEGIRGLLDHWLSEAGHNVQTADCGQQAVRLLQQEPFDIVITDVVMPDGDGFELIPAIRKIQPEARILAISGGGRYIPGGDCLSLARGLGAHASVIKPFDCGDVLRGVANALGGLAAKIA